MPLDRFLIAPLNSGLKINTINASFGMINEKTERFINMSRKNRIDIKDISGIRFGDLIAISAVGPGKYRGIKWLCKCDCGKECIAYGGHLRDGTRKSCGCRSQKRIFETGINRIFSSYKAMASRRKKLFSLTREEFEKLVQSNCYYCGREPFNELKRLKTKKLQIMYSGIDRFDPLKSYTSDNCVPCCYYCNHSKADLSFEEWKSHLKLLFSYQRISNGT